MKPRLHILEKILKVNALKISIKGNKKQGIQTQPSLIIKFLIPGTQQIKTVFLISKEKLNNGLKIGNEKQLIILFMNI